MTGDDVLRWLDHLPPGTATILGEAGRHLLQHQLMLPRSGSDERSIEPVSAR
jgi:hypothetical protein